jgi:hypothetical protein
MIDPNENANVVVKALAAEYVRVRNKANSSEKLLVYARSQTESEGSKLTELIDQLNMLADAILSAGGEIPPNDEPVVPASTTASGRAGDQP